MNNLHISQGGTLAPDGIPLHYGNLEAEYRAAIEHVVLMDRSHEGRLQSSGKDRLELIQRISTNDVLHLAENEGCATILTTPTSRIIDRLTVYNRGETALILTEPGRGDTVLHYLQRQVFFNDEVQFTNTAADTKLFALHGPEADSVIRTFIHDYEQGPKYKSYTASINDTRTTFAQRKALSGSHWAIVTPSDGAEAVWSALQDAGTKYGMKVAGSLTYNTLRIRAGRPGVGRELTTEYIPLEAGLWDEVSFSKGCYTGQEIIARMESRNRLAKIMVMIKLDVMVEAPAALHREGAVVGTLTSSVPTPDGEIRGIGFVKLAFAEPLQAVSIGDQHTPGTIIDLAGTQLSTLRQQA